jgi:hypothetical protein
MLVVVSHRFVFGDRAEKDSNLQFVRDMLTRNAPDQKAVMRKYRDVRRGKRSVANEEADPICVWLRLSGVVRNRDGTLSVSNFIYQTVFDVTWITKNYKVDWAERARSMFWTAALSSATLFLIVTILFFNNVSIVLGASVNKADEEARSVANQIEYAASLAVPDFTSTDVDKSNPEAIATAVASYLRTDSGLNNELQSSVGNWNVIYDAGIVDASGKVILNTNPSLIGARVPDRPNLVQLVHAGLRNRLRMIYSLPSIYEVKLPMQLGDQPFGSVRVGVSTLFMRNELTVRLLHTAFFYFLAVGICITLAVSASFFVRLN